MVMAHGQPRDGDRQHRPARRRREPAARPEQRPGLLRHGLVPARALRLPPRLRRRDARDVRRGVGRRRSDASPACASPTCSTPPSTATFKGLYVQGEDIAAVRPQHQARRARRSRAMECVVVQDLFLNETANYAHVFLPGSTFLEKDGTFTNAERRISRVRKVMPPQDRLRRLGSHHAASPTRWATRCTTAIPSEIMDEIARLTPTFAGVSYEKLDRARLASSGPATTKAPRRHADHAHRRLRARQGPVHDHRVRADRRAHRDRASRCC